MQPEFNLDREQKNQLYLAFGRCSNTPFHFHSQIEIYLITEGEAEVWINDRRKILSAGELSVAFSYDAHRYLNISQAKIICLIIPTDLFGEFLPMFRNKRIGEPFSDDPVLYKKIRSCCEAIAASEHEMTKRGYLYVILGTMLERMRFEERAASADPRFSANMLLYIRENFKNDISLSSVASALGYNPAYLSREFRTCFQIGFHQYVTVLRLREAVLLMKRDGKSVTEAAFESGFQSLRTFYRAFYDEFRCTPKEYLQGTKCSHIESR